MDQKTERWKFEYQEFEQQEFGMFIRNIAIVAWSLPVMAVAWVGVSLFGRFGGIKSFSVVAGKGGRNASPMATFVSQAMFVGLVIVVVGFVVWGCWRVVISRRRKPDDRE